MKKRWIEEKARRRNRSHAESSLARRTLTKQRKRESGRRAAPPERRLVDSRHHRPPVSYLAPDVLSIVNSPQDTAAFFRRLQSHTLHRDVYVDLSAVTSITPDAVALLLSIVDLLGKQRGLAVSGNYPANDSASQTICQSGFDEFVRTSRPKSSSTSGHIVKRDLSQSSTRADGYYASKLINFAAKGGSSSLRLKVPYGILLECMGNTHQHAGECPGDERWYASVFRDNIRQCDCFTFVDMGVGIFNSLELTARLRMYNVTGWGRPKILRELLDGKIRSSTRKSYRGRGLPSIYRACIDEKIRRLVLVTNDVYADVEAAEFRDLSADLKGVVLYWEVPHERS